MPLDEPGPAPRVSRGRETVSLSLSFPLSVYLSLVPSLFLSLSLSLSLFRSLTAELHNGGETTVVYVHHDHHY